MQKFNMIFKTISIYNNNTSRFMLKYFSIFCNIAKTTGTRIPDPLFPHSWSLPRLWYGSLSGSTSLNHLSIFYNISCYNSLVLLTFVSRSSCRFTYIYIKVRNNRQNTKRESSLRLDILQ